MRTGILHLLIAASLVAWSSTESVSDRLRIENIAGDDNVVVMMTSRDVAGCHTKVLRTTGELELGDMLSGTGECNSEIVVFAANNAMAISSPAWTSSVHTLTLQPIIQVPVSVWIAHPEGAERAQIEIANANLIYRQNRVGVQLIPTFRDVSSNASAVKTIGSWCHAIGAVRGSPWYTPKTLNIYYVEAVKPSPSVLGAFKPAPGSAAEQTAPGWNCDRFPDDFSNDTMDANISYIGVKSGSNLATLAHEIGHAFGLRPGDKGGHTNSENEFRENNVMWGEGKSTRNHFSLGQVFRMNTQHDRWGGTMLIANGLRPAIGRECPPRFKSSNCPSLAVDWERQQEAGGAEQTLANWLEARYEQLVAQRKTISYAPVIVSKQRFLELYLGQ